MNDHIGAIENLLLTSVAMERLPMIEVITLLMESLENNMMNFRFLTEEQYKEVQNLNKEYSDKIDKILEKEEIAERPFLYINLLLPILSITKKAVKHSSYLLRLRP